MEVTLAQAESFVERMPMAHWNGWTIQIFHRNPNGLYKRNGAFRNGAWHTVYAVEMNNNGKYFIPKKYLGTIRH